MGLPCRPSGAAQAAHLIYGAVRKGRTSSLDLDCSNHYHGPAKRVRFKSGSESRLFAGLDSSFFKNAGRAVGLRLRRLDLVRKVSGRAAQEDSVSTTTDTLPKGNSS